MAGGLMWRHWNGSQVIFLAGDILLLPTALLASAWLRFDGQIPADTVSKLPLVAFVALVTKITCFATQGLYSLSWSQIGLTDMIRVFRGVTLGTAAFWAVVFLLVARGPLMGFPRAILLVDYVITLYVVGTLRIGRRVYDTLLLRSPNGRRTLIVGAGEAGEQLARSLIATRGSGYTLVGFIDDDLAKWHVLIHGVRVLGSRDDLPDVVQAHRIETVLIAMPSASSQVIRHVVTEARKAGVHEIRIVPGLDRTLNARVEFDDLREVNLTDLLGRQVVRIDTAAIEGWLCGRRVLVTGAGGSIGSELCRQISRFRPSTIALVDFDETELFWIEQELHGIGQPAVAFPVDVRDLVHVRQVMAQVSPQVVFHAAAYKHVGMMERNPGQAVMTNIIGTLRMAHAAREAGAEKFVLVSTDKAVNPTSVMGVSKRVAEQVCLALDCRGGTRFVAVRFGNVLGSRGSVVPIFQERIRRGEPLVVRGPEMRRYFMATDEAVLLVLQAGTMSRGGEIFVLDMGEPVRIIDLARELVRLSGLEPDKDVPIVMAEPEPGEKELEDLLTAEEGTVATQHDRVFTARGNVAVPAETMLAAVDRLEELVQASDLEGIVETLRVLVPNYQPSDFLRERLRHTPPKA